MLVTHGAIAKSIDRQCLVGIAAAKRQPPYAPVSAALLTAVQVRHFKAIEQQHK
jgi:hypothetical protein